ncbi:LacI family DNA-binding transcriptional regulator [Microbacterium marinilacus]|uniref:LacI family DNA-binding transcriptional regulator n=1 Tax=Microbacterium marinilacus TaxID=415209 RepID=A0ABP7B7C4_9MICO|nr:LacI family DNA-binding transcriptional regulator [Microbacterium marinilacus]MBY0687565.1 LacI family transcriptional regulator [Microbacterium marinilacus]
MGRLPRLEDVAAAAGVSRQTVSNVINSPGIVRDDTRERVSRAIADLGYRPHAAARSLRTRRSSTIAIHLDPYAGGISGVVLDRFVHALTDLAGTRGMRVLLYTARGHENEIARLRELLDGGEADAVVITGTVHDDPRTRWLAARQTPFVAFGRPWGDDARHSWVDVDGAAGTREATRWALANAGAHVAFLGWPAGSDTGDDRESGWRSALAAADGLRLVAEESVGDARDVVAGVLASGDDIDALVCASDSLAVGAHLAAVAAGRPGLPIIGFDNTPAAEAIGLSSVEQLPEKVASAALDLLLSPSDASSPDGGESRHVLVEPQLVLR